MKTDANGCSACPAGTEQYESFRHNRVSFIQYDYRANNGELFSCVAKTLDQCREKRDKHFQKEQTK